MINLTKPFISNHELSELQKTIKSGWLVEGPKTTLFEKKISSFQNIKYVSALTSCTAALHLAVHSLRLNVNDEILVPAFSWATTAHCVEYLNLKIRFVDIDLNTFNINAKDLEKKISKKTKALIVVHLFGKSANMSEIIKISKENDIQIIEDCACALGTLYKNKPVGSFGSFSCFSFHPRKIITTGEGGAICTNKRYLYQKVKVLKNHGCSGPNKNEKIGPWTMANVSDFGFNYRFNDILAALGIQQINKINLIIKKRRKLALIYTKRLENFDLIRTPENSNNFDYGHTFQSYVIKINSKERIKRNKIMSYLFEKKIQTRPGTFDLTSLDYYRKKISKKEKFTNSKIAFDTTITLPLFPDLTVNQIEYICENLIKSCKKYL